MVSRGWTGGGPVVGREVGRKMTTSRSGYCGVPKDTEVLLVLQIELLTVGVAVGVHPAESCHPTGKWTGDECG